MERRQVPFVWGSNDCVLFACDAIQAITGLDVVADFRGKYSNPAEALRTVHDFLKLHDVTPAPDSADRFYLAQFSEVIAATNKFAEVVPFAAQRGDLVLFDQTGEDYQTLAIVAMDGWHIAAPTEQFRFTLKHGLRAWRIA